jgi:hypothetical protein
MANGELIVTLTPGDLDFLREIVDFFEDILDFADGEDGE